MRALQGMTYYALAKKNGAACISEAGEKKKKPAATQSPYLMRWQFPWTSNIKSPKYHPRLSEGKRDHVLASEGCKNTGSIQHSGYEMEKKSTHQ